MVLEVSPIAFQGRPPVCALKKAHIRAIKLRCAKVCQPESFILFANLAGHPILKPLPDLCMGLNTPLCTVPTHRSVRSQHTAPYSSIVLTSAV
jgi:hypothetical protein